MNRAPGAHAAALLCVCLALTSSARAQPDQASDPNDPILERLAELEARLDEQEDENLSLQRQLQALTEQTSEQDHQAEGARSERAETEELGPVLSMTEKQRRRLGLMGGMYAKPFLLRAGGAFVGGYIDISYRDAQNAGRRFVQQRFIPFIFAEVTDTIRFAAEIEFEYGGPDFARGDGEVKIEYAALDWQLAEAFGLRAGAILVPLGKFNQVHDSPVNDLTDRPLVDRYVVPTTFTEAGIGAFGTLYPGGEWQIDYEVYLTNGFVGLVRDSSAPTGYRSEISRTKGLRDARPGMKFDNNDSVAVTGRLAFSPALGAEVGLSTHVGRYDDRGENFMRVYALDWTFQMVRFSDALAGLEFQGELAWADIGRDGLARASGVPADLWGLYAQINHHFMFDALRDALPVVFGKESTFTAVLRLEHIDLDGNRLERLTPGLNFRPVEDTAFKIGYQFNFEDWKHTREKNDAVVFSIATYF